MSIPCSFCWAEVLNGVCVKCKTTYPRWSLRGRSREPEYYAFKDLPPDDEEDGYASNAKRALEDGWQARA